MDWLTLICLNFVIRKDTLLLVEKMATSCRRCLAAHYLDPEIQAAPHIIREAIKRLARAFWQCHFAKYDGIWFATRESIVGAIPLTIVKRLAQGGGHFGVITSPSGEDVCPSR